MVALTGSESSEELQGAHNEVVAIVNMRPGTTLDRGKLVEKYGSDYQAFNVDAWAFETAARELYNDAISDDEVQDFVVAMTYYNIATAITLCGPNMRIIMME